MELLLIYAVVLGVFYIFYLRPQQQKRRRAAQLLASLDVGDEIVLDSGIHGFVVSLADDVVWIEVAEGVELKVLRSSVAATIVEPEEEEEAPADTSTDD